MTTKSNSHYKKYQVYFFLYLAVICELLIIIVERDDAEASLMMQQRMLEEKNRKIILELLKNMPAVATAGDNQLKIGETRSFTITVQGLGERDEVTSHPVVSVVRDGQEVETLAYPDQIADSVRHGVTGDRIYRFDWTARHGPGSYELWVNAGTDRVALQPGNGGDARIKVGTLEFAEGEIRSALDSDPELSGTPVAHFVDMSASLNPDRFFVEVVSEEYDQLQLQADPVTTAAGYATVNEIKVRGTTVDRIATIDVSSGRTLAPDQELNPWRSNDPARGKWAWYGVINEPGTYTVEVDARDHRQAGGKSVASTRFPVDVRLPVMHRDPPSGAFAGELFNMSVAVDGLDDAGQYSWTASLDGEQIAQGAFSDVTIAVPMAALGQALEIDAVYASRPYLIADDEALAPSHWTYIVSAPVDRIGSASFARGGEYPINNVFQFVAARCGRCIGENIRNLNKADIRVDVESADGQDLLDEVQILPRIDPNSGRELGSVVKFWLHGRVSREGTDAVITVRAGSVHERYNVVLYTE